MMHDHGNCARCDALEADLAAMRGALIRLLGELSCCYACDGPDRDGENLRHGQDCYVASALASSPGAPWLATAREVVEALEDFCGPLAYTGDPEYGRAVVAARALLARPEVQEMRGR